MKAVLGFRTSIAAVIGHSTSVYINLLLLFREIIMTQKPYWEWFSYCRNIHVLKLIYTWYPVALELFFF